ncbi:hypothetical protein CYY_006993 [Polysphondylium violaceum]|uniref:Uncharacterized protein n=1 Tax=Polysphondylium violaceum TaxID=133409 RepID=A0A8J4PQB7_9MYCE|nr:hypothetical protein CYY_006993 [Polysphondylium violaceum]
MDINNNNNNNNNNSNIHTPPNESIISTPTSTTPPPPQPPISKNSSALSVLYGTMEELVAAADSLSTRLLDLSELKTLFDYITSILNVDNDTLDQAWSLIVNLQLPNDTTELQQKYYIASALFLSGNSRFSNINNSKSNEVDNSNNSGSSKKTKQSKKKQSSNNNNNNSSKLEIKNNNIKPHTIILSQLLKKLNIDILPFFENLKSFLSLSRFNSTVEESVKNLENSFNINSLICRKYEFIFYNLFIKENNNNNNNQNINLTNEEYLLNIGWLLYLFCKSQLFGDVPDLIQSTHLILCILNLLYIKSSQDYRKIAIHQIIDTDSHSIFQYLSKQTNCNHDDLLSFNKDTFILLLDQLISKDLFKFKFNNNVDQNDFNNINNSNNNNIDQDDDNININNDNENENNRDDNNLQDIFTEQLLKFNYTSLNKIYQHNYYINGEIDERTLIGSTTTPTTNVNSNNNNNNKLLSNRKYQQLNTPGGTPISAALSMESWMNHIIKNEKDPIPSDNLELLLKNLVEQKSIKPETKSNIVNRIETLTLKVNNLYHQDELAFKNENDLNLKRKNIAIRLYFNLLEKILLKEELSASPSFETLLSNEDFHKSVLSSSFEMVSYIYKLDRFYFPYFVNIFQIHPFSYVRLVEWIIRVEESLPKPLVHHFNFIEEKILDKYTWIGDDSKVFMILSNHKQILSTNPQQSPKVIYTFYKKLNNYINIRCRKMCQALNLPMDVVYQSCLVMSKLLLENNLLLRNRTIEILLICSLYGVCKVNHITISFKTIIEKVHIPQKVYKDIVLFDDETNTGANEYGDIICFYNKIFLKKMDIIIHSISQNFKKQNNSSNTTPTTTTTTTTILSSTSNLNNFSTQSPIQNKQINKVLNHTPTKNVIPLSPQKNLNSNFSISISNNIISPMKPSTPKSNNNINFNNNRDITTITTGVNSPIFGTPSKNLLTFNIGKSPAKELQQMNQNMSIFSQTPDKSTTSSIKKTPSSLTTTTTTSGKGKRLLFEDDDSQSSQSSQSSSSSSSSSSPPSQLSSLSQSPNSQSPPTHTPSPPSSPSPTSSKRLKN